MKYKVGDKVRVRSDLELGKKYGHMIFTHNMKTLRGKVVTIEEERGLSYMVEEHNKPWWTDEMFEGLAEETPNKYKVGDRVKIVGANIRQKEKYIGEVVTIRQLNPNGIKNTENFPYGVEEREKDIYVWFEDELQLYEEPTPTPIQVNVNINVNINIDNYANACWYCRKGGVVDLYFNGQLGVCPHCGRVCNQTTVEEMTKSHKPANPFKKENKPLTTEELKALPEGTRVFTVWLTDGTPQLEDYYTCWRTKQGDKLKRKHGQQCIVDNGKSFYAYLEKPDDAVDSGK